MNLPYIGSTRNSMNGGIGAQISTPVGVGAAAGGGSNGGGGSGGASGSAEESSSMVNGRRKHFVHKYPKNMDSKLMSDILGGPLIEEIKKDPVGIPRRPRSMSKQAMEKFPIQPSQQPSQQLNISIDQGQMFYDADRLRQAQSSANLQNRHEMPLGDRISLENEIVELRDRLWKQEKGMMDVVKSLEDRMYSRQSAQDGDLVSHLNQNKMQLQSYENKLREMERTTDDLRRNLQQSEMSQKELLGFMKSMQQQVKSEFCCAQMRQLMNVFACFEWYALVKQESSQMQNLKGLIDEENSTLQKEREKTMALFQEVVRLGENQERQQQSTNGSNAALEEKLRQLEQKVQNGERVASQLAQKGDKSISQVGEVTALKMQDVMNEIHQLQRELANQKSSIRGGEEATQRLESEIRNALKSMQQDQSGQIDSLAAQMQQRSITERDEKQQLANELSSLIETKHRQANDRAAGDKSDMYQKLQQVESVAKAESVRSQDGIAQLKNAVEQQIKFIMAQMKSSENERILAEESIRAELIHSKDHLMRELESLKNYQTGVTEKITEMMRQEMQTRLDSDVDLKNLASSIAGDIVKDVNRMKDSIEKQFGELQSQAVNQSSECSQRCAKLSTFAEQECSNIGNEFSKKFEKMREMFTKLAEQFKTHLVNEETQSNAMHANIVAGFDAKLNAHSQSLVTQLTDTQHLHGEKAAGELKLIEHELAILKAQFQDRCNKIEEENLKDIEVVKDALNDLTNAFNENMSAGGNARVQNKHTNDELIAHVEARLQEVVNHSNGIKVQVNAFEDRIAEIEDSVGGFGAQQQHSQQPHSIHNSPMSSQHSSHAMEQHHHMQSSPQNNQAIAQNQADIKLIAANQTELTRQLQADIDHLAQTISVVDQNRHKQVQEIIDYNQTQQKQMAKDLELVRESVLGNLKMINETTQTLEVIHSMFEEKVIAIEAEIALEKTLNKTDIQELMANVDYILSILKQSQSKQQSSVQQSLNALNSSNAHLSLIKDRNSPILRDRNATGALAAGERNSQNNALINSGSTNVNSGTAAAIDRSSAHAAAVNNYKQSTNVNSTLVGSSEQSSKRASLTVNMTNLHGNNYPNFTTEPAAISSSNNQNNRNANNFSNSNNGGQSNISSAQKRRPSVLGERNAPSAASNEGRQLQSQKIVHESSRSNPRFDVQDKKLQQVLENIKQRDYSARNNSMSPMRSPGSAKDISITFQTKLNEISYAQDMLNSKSRLSKRIEQ